ncbi:MAG: MotA/TolQ/ExbB proton channel family protein [Chloroflexi bacterium]|nr:MotA/TolQ/ExbB proton channel family protein [Chloroflexota bacterium]
MPYVEVLVFWLAIICLVARCRSITGENDLFERTRREWSQILSKVGPSSTIPVCKCEQILVLVANMKQELLSSKAGSRLYAAVWRFHGTRSSKDADDVLSTLSEMDAAATESAYGNLRFFAWLIPTLGFIGTVIGVGQGIAGFGEIVKGSSETYRDVFAEIPKVTHNLGIAFDTTLLALLLTVIVLLLMGCVQRRDELLLYMIDVFCVEEIVGSFEDADEHVEAIRDLSIAFGKHIDRQTEQLAAALADGTRTVDLSKIETSVHNIEARIDRQISEESEKIQAVIHQPEHAKSVGQMVEDLKKVTTKTITRFERSFDTMQQNLAETTNMLNQAATTLNTYVTDGAVAEAAEFAGAVADLKAGLQPMVQAVSELSRASDNLKGLADLSTAADKLEKASIRIESATGRIQTGSEGIATAGTNLTGIIADNRTVLEGVKNVLANTTDSIDHLSKIISSMNTTLWRSRRLPMDCVIRRNAATWAAFGP